MILFSGFFGLIALGVWIFCIIDAITTPREQVRSLPKLVWVAIVVLLVDVGSIAWLVAGRPWNARATTPGGARSSGFAGLGSASTSVTRTRARPTNPDDDDEFLAGLAERNRRLRNDSSDGGDNTNGDGTTGDAPEDGPDTVR